MSLPAHIRRWSEADPTLIIKTAIVRSTGIPDREYAEFVNALRDRGILASEDHMLPSCSRTILWHPESDSERLVGETSLELGQQLIVICQGRRQINWALSLIDPKNQVAIYTSATEYLDALATASQTSVSKEAVIV